MRPRRGSRLRTGHAGQLEAERRPVDFHADCHRHRRRCFAGAGRSAKRAQGREAQAAGRAKPEELKQVKQLAPKVADKPEDHHRRRCRSRAETEGGNESRTEADREGGKAKAGGPQARSACRQIEKGRGEEVVEAGKRRTRNSSPIRSRRNCGRTTPKSRLSNSTPVRSRPCSTSASRGARWRPPPRKSKALLRIPVHTEFIRNSSPVH